MYNNGMGTAVRQVNNLKIKRDMEGIYHVVTPAGVCLEEFTTLEKAIVYAQSIKDFVRKAAH